MTAALHALDDKYIFFKHFFHWSRLRRRNAASGFGVA